MPNARTPSLLAAGATALVLACATASPSRSPAEVTPEPTTEAQPSAQATVESAAASTDGDAAADASPAATGDEVPAGPPEGAFAGCAAKLDEGPTRERTIAGRKASQQGSRLRFTEPDADGKLVVGVLGPVNEASGLNLLALRRFLQRFAEAGVEAIVVTGDVGETQAGITRVLDELASAKQPVLVVSGNRECKDDYAQGVADAQQRSDAIINLNAIRVVELGNVTFVSLPGHYDRNFITCETGCQYDARTLEDVVTVARAAEHPVVLVSHGPPRGASAQAIDSDLTGSNAGDPQVNRVLRDGKIAFGFFSNIKEAGARATTGDLATQVPQDRPAKALLLNPGPADTSRWEMNDGSFSYGFAAVVTFEKGTAAWKLLRSGKPGPEEKKAARELVK